MTLLQNGPWRAGLGVGGDLQKPRKASDSDRLSGLGDIDGTALGSAFARYDAGPLVARGSVITDIGGKGQGTRANLDIEVRYSPLPKLILSAGPDRNYMQTFFGITAAQSAASGINALRFGCGANYQRTPKWGLGARVTFSSLRGDAGDSPITEKKANTRVALFANYRF